MASKAPVRRPLVTAPSVVQNRKKPKVATSTSSASTAKRMELKIFRTKKEIYETEDKLSAGARRTHPLASTPTDATAAAAASKRASVDVGALEAATVAGRSPAALAKSKSLDSEPTASAVAVKPKGILKSAKILLPRFQLTRQPPASDDSTALAARLAGGVPKSRLPLRATLGSTPRPNRKLLAPTAPKPTAKASVDNESSRTTAILTVDNKIKTHIDYNNISDDSKVDKNNKDEVTEAMIVDCNYNDENNNNIKMSVGNDNKTARVNGTKQSSATTKRQYESQQQIHVQNESVEQLAENRQQQQQLTSHGTDSQAHVSQSVHVRRREVAGEAYAIVRSAAIRPTDRLQSLPSVYEEAVRFGADGAADARDHFVFLAPPEQTRVAAGLASHSALPYRVVSQSTASIDRVGSPPAKPARVTIAGSALELRASHYTAAAATAASVKDSDDFLLTTDLPSTNIGSVPALPKFPLSEGNSLPPVLQPAASGRYDVPVTRHVEKINKKTSLPTNSGGSGVAAKFADKLSRSFFDLTLGSHDRLLRWKTKLQQQYGGQHSSVNEKKDAPSSKSAASQRAAKKSMYGSRAQPPASAPTADAEPAGQWHAKSRSGDATTGYPYRHSGNLERPAGVQSQRRAATGASARPLRASRSSSNALDSEDNNNINNNKGSGDADNNSIYRPLLLNSSEKFGGSTTVFPRLAAAETRRRNSTIFAEDRSCDNDFYDNKVEYDYGTYAGAKDKSINNIYKRFSKFENHLQYFADTTSNSLREDGITFLSSAWDRRLPSSEVSTNATDMEHRTLRQRYVNNNNNNNYCGGGTNIIAGALLKPLPPSTTTFQAWRSAETAASASNENHLPPPARILPYSGIKPQDNAIIRPIAFRPITTAGGSEAAQKLAHRQSIGMELASAYYDSGPGQGSFRQQPNTNGSTIALPTSAAAAGPSESAAAAAYEHHRQTLRDQSRSIGNLASMTGSYYGDGLGIAGYSGAQMFDRPAALRRLAPYQQRSVDAPPPPAAVSARTTAAQLKRHASMVTAPSSVRDEDAPYDTVPADAGRPRILHEYNSASSGPYIPFLPQQHSNNNNDSTKSNVPKTSQLFKKNLRYGTSTTFSTVQQQQDANTNGIGNNFVVARHAAASTTASISSGASSRCTNGSPRGAVAGTKTKPTTANSATAGTDRQTAAAGLHITPSPSDSGIVDYETLIRDKEHELSSVRHAMEQNEEVMIRVYQDKECQFSQQIADLRQQVAHSETIRQQLAASVRLLTDDRNVYQRRCQQVERELDALRTRCQNLERLARRSLTAADDASSTASSCAKCSRAAELEKESAPAEPSVAADPNNLDCIYENAAMASIVLIERRERQPPVPTPRCSLKESTLSLGSDDGRRELRTEVDDLRGEISSLRAQLNDQFKYFSEERQRWKAGGQPPTEFSAIAATAQPTISTAADVTMSGDRLI